MTNQNQPYLDFVLSPLSRYPLNNSTNLASKALTGFAWFVSGPPGQHFQNSSVLIGCKPVGMMTGTKSSLTVSLIPFLV